MGLTATLLAALLALDGPNDDSHLVIHASKVVNRITPWMYGSCIEDVNHEIYGGLYAQMIFGESFEESPRIAPGWNIYGGRWTWKEGGVLSVESDFGAKVVSDGSVPNPPVSCQLRFLDDKGDNAGMLVRVREPRIGADNWIGYEISLSVKHQYLMLGRHRNNFQMLKQVPIKVEPGKWYSLRVSMAGPRLRIYVDGSTDPVIDFEDKSEPILEGGGIGLRTWGSNVEFRWVNLEFGGPMGNHRLMVPSQVFDPNRVGELGLSAMWDPVQTRDAVLRAAWDADRPFNTAHSQRIERGEGTGAVGIANSGLNRWGLTFRQGQSYDGRVYLRQEGYVGKVTVAIQSQMGNRIYARQELGDIGGDWTRREFSLKPDATITGRFVLLIDGPGKVWVDQVYLAPTGDELFQGLPFRGDIGRALQREGLTLLRYGGCMVNAPEYRWKQMIGDRDRRPQYKGWWYPQTTNGFGIEDFVIFCRAAGFEPVVAINIEETPQDIADLIEYMNGPDSTEWGRRRAANGHREPYGLRFLQIGNEEKTDEHYIERFKLLHDAIRTRDSKVELIIGAWWEPDNPVSKRIVQDLNGKAALWDVHVGGDDPREGAKVDALFTRMERLVREWAPGTNLKACVLEENGGHHDMARALGHAGIVNATQRHGDFVLIDCPANCLQPWLQNDNDWDQGQLFLDSGRVWGMPPYYAQQMAAKAHQPLRLASEATSPGNDLDLTATRDEAGTSVVLKVVNAGGQPHRAAVSIDGFGPIDTKAEVRCLSGALDDRNSADLPDRLRPSPSEYDRAGEDFSFEFPARSYTILRLRPLRR
jgi:alpha-L-arabinofuranosidase